MRRGYDVQILSKLRRSEMYGAQYLHENIPGLTDGQEEPVQVHYRLIGTPAGYRQKVYGDRPAVQTSVQTLQELHWAWDIRAAYHKAWDMYRDRITDRVINPLELQQIVRLNKRVPIISSIPLPQLCFKQDEHKFISQSIWAIGDAPERGVFVPFTVDPNTIICDGTRDVGWYRAANVFGYGTIEWPAGTKPPISGISQVSKPLSSDCNCFAGRIVRVGRYGRWEKGVLAHHAYEQAVKL